MVAWDLWYNETSASEWDEIDFPAESLRLPENIHYRIHILEFFLNQLELPQAYLEPSQSMMELFCLLSKF